MKIAILYIATGKYNVFWSDFYKSAEKYFLPEAERKYFLFTDDSSIPESTDVTIIHRECRGFPLDSLFRFEMFLQIEGQLCEFDYIFFFNANMLFVNLVGEEVLPDKQSNGLVALQHPGYWKSCPEFFPYERNKHSLAYIPKRNKKYIYYMGSLNGGAAKEYLELIRCCADNIQQDYQRGIIAIFHDESHINKYFSEHPPLALSPSYGYPEGQLLSVVPKIMIRDKVKVSGYFDKQKGDFLIKKIIRRLKIIYKAVTW